MRDTLADTVPAPVPTVTRCPTARTARSSTGSWARTKRSYARLEAPFDGVVAARWADPGDLAVPGKPILAVARNGALRVRAQLPVEDLAVLAVGQRVT
ncbi:MAG: HlyD family efflux transporter periplasmic adaptor subunit, partial [Deltaproteobacteria bacterium]|nr:HlyD family efflux transporter periplasmic adaptor subunit [Deltaproteobacteria bacterium]